MSATTIVETYDTQMDYASDYDVAMQTAGSSSDVWAYHGEVMEQDAHHDSQSVGRESVEVDMEEYPDADHESVEYEMEDEQIYGNEGGDLLDVEVYDASQAHSPAMLSSMETTLSSDPIDYPIQGAPVFPAAHAALAHSDPPPIIHEETFIPDITTDDSHTVDAGLESAPHFEENDDSANATVTISESHLAEPEAPSLTETSAPADHALPVASASTDDAAAEHSRVTETTEEQQLTHVEDNHVGDSEATVNDLTYAQGQEHDVPSEQVIPADGTTHDEHEERQEEGQDYHGEHYEAADESVDPHEISEGVYIDPPPAVMLSLPLSQQEELCLFNQPIIRSGSRSPTDESHQPVQQTMPLMLHDRPTLYYESLANVFEALRQEESLAHIPGFAEGELVLDAYDLQLVVSEDNAHAREVTLHDLNILHDGSDLSGPLRLRLHVVSPRFILRYHMLRDQIARLNLASEGAEGQDVSYNEHYDEALGQDLQEVQEDNAEHYEEDLIYQEEHTENTGQEPAQDPNSHPGGSLESVDEAAGEVATGEVEEPESYEEHAVAEGTEVHDTGAEIYEDDHEATLKTDHAPHDEAEADASSNFVLQSDATSHDAGQGQNHLNAEEQAENDDDQFLDQPTSAHEQKATNMDEPQPDSAFSEGTETTFEPHLDTEESPLDDVEDSIGAVHNAENTEAQHDLDTAPYTETEPDESDANFVALLEQEADQIEFTGAEDNNTSLAQEEHEVTNEYPELEDEQDWDEELDGEGEVDPTLTTDLDDGVSNESSVTLSSTASVNKRGHDEVDSGDELDADDEAANSNSPGLKRPRVQ